MWNGTGNDPAYPAPSSTSRHSVQPRIPRQAHHPATSAILLAMRFAAAFDGIVGEMSVAGRWSSPCGDPGASRSSQTFADQQAATGEKNAAGDGVTGTRDERTPSRRGHAPAESAVGRTVAGQRRTRRKRSGRLSGNTSEIPHLGGNLLVKHTLALGFGPGARALAHLYHASTQFLATSYGYDTQNRQVALQLRAQGSFRRLFCGSLLVRGRCPEHRRWPVGVVRRGWACAHASSRRRRVGRWR